MLNLLGVLLFSLVLTTVNIPVLSKAVSIFDVTWEVLGLKEADFQGRLPKETVLARMKSQTRRNYDELELTDPGAFKFMKMLYGHAVRAADHPWEAQEAFYKVVNFYKKNMTVSQLNNLHGLFPVIEKIFPPLTNAKDALIPSQQSSAGDNRNSSNVLSDSTAKELIVDLMEEKLKKAVKKFDSLGNVQLLLKTLFRKNSSFESILMFLKDGLKEINDTSVNHTNEGGIDDMADFSKFLIPFLVRDKEDRKMFIHMLEKVKNKKASEKLKQLIKSLEILSKYLEIQRPSHPLTFQNLAQYHKFRHR